MPYRNSIIHIFVFEIVVVCVLRTEHCESQNTWAMPSMPCEAVASPLEVSRSLLLLTVGDSLSGKMLEGRFGFDPRYLTTSLAMQSSSSLLTAREVSG